MTLDELRKAIDAVDDEILERLNRRALLAADVGRLKELADAPFYVPSRERAIVERLVAANRGPFPAESLRHVFGEIFSACLALERGLRIAYFGPEGTFTHMAVKYQFGLSADAIPCGTIAAVFAEVEKGAAEFGVVPVENSSEGVVNHTLDTFFESTLLISAEIVLDVTQCLLGRRGLELGQLERVYSHPQALGQCRDWLAANLPRARLVEAASTADAARLAREDAAGAAIGSELAADLHELAVLRGAIQDAPDNATRFLVIGRRQAERTGRDKTSVLMMIKDGPGVLFRILAPFAEAGVNLTKIESRPSRRRPWEYAFFVDLEGHESDPEVRDALTALAPLCHSVKVLGSYPRGG